MKFSKFLILLLLIPTVANASWWNPVSWFAKKTEVVKALPVRNENKVIFVATSTSEEKKEQASSTTSVVVDKVVDNKSKKATSTIIKAEITKNETSKVSNRLSKKCKNSSVVSVEENCMKICPNGEKIEEGLVCKTVLKQKTVMSEVDELAKKNQKKCLSGVILNLQEDCTKVCPDKEIILENSSCKTTTEEQLVIDEKKKLEEERLKQVEIDNYAKSLLQQQEQERIKYQQALQIQQQLQEQEQLKLQQAQRCDQYKNQKMALDNWLGSSGMWNNSSSQEKINNLKARYPECQ